MLMINVIAIILIVFSIGQILLGIATLTGKFEPLLPKERKKLPAKARRQARVLNALAMIQTGIAPIILSASLLFELNSLVIIAAIMYVVIAILVILAAVLVLGIGNYLNKAKAAASSVSLHNWSISSIATEIAEQM